MKLYLHNTLENKRQLFQPQDAERVTLYACGPTVYGPIHVGNARPAVVFDVLFRLLKRHYKRVDYARNITDIDDKIISAAQANNESTTALSQRWHQSYLANLAALQVLPPTHEPLATDYIAPMIEMIKKLVDKNFAYAHDGHVLFHVPAFKDYGALSNRDRKDMIDGARVEVSDYKKDAADFILWKPSTPDLPGWDSPWGRGRPGWHIECSTMAFHCLGKTIDIHGGGQDLIFPHHENELAQSRCCHDTDFFAKYWLHNGHVRIEGEKMSKSQDNFITVNGALQQYHGECIRLALLSTHYRRPMNWTKTALEEAKTVLDRWYRLLNNVNGNTEGNLTVAATVEAALCDDLNTPAAISNLHQMAGDLARTTDADKKSVGRDSFIGSFIGSAQALGLLYTPPDQWFQQTTATSLSPKEIEALIAERTEAKQQKNFSRADEIRDQLSAQGIVLEDKGRQGTSWRRK